MKEFYHNMKNISNYKTLGYLLQTEQNQKRGWCRWQGQEEQIQQE